MNKLDEEFQLRFERGQRARQVREKILSISRTRLAKKHHIPLSTLQSWEDASLGGMIETGAKKLLSIFKAEGVHVTLEWLMYGIGPSPLPEYVTKSPSHSHEKLSTENIIAQELKLFHDLNPHAVHMIINDDAFAPWLSPGDYVAGQWYFNEEIKHHLGVPAIVQTATGHLLTRIVEAEKEDGCYRLKCMNSHAAVKEAVIHNIKLFSVAPIIWIRKTKINKKF